MAAPGAPPPNSPGTYTELYAVMTDVMAGEYQQFMDTFSVENAQQPAQLRDSVMNAGTDVPKVFTYLSNDPPRVGFVHRLTKYAPTLGRTSTWDNDLFAFASDVGPGNQVSVVRWPDTAFSRTATVHVPTTDDMGNQWAAAAGADCVGPYTAASPNVEEIRTRFFMAVPPAYTSLVLRRQSFTPHEFWTDVVELIIADGRGAACASLVNWARVACTYRPDPGPGAPLPPASHCTDPLAVPVMDSDLLDRVWKWVSTDLPALNERAGTVAQAATQAMANLQVEFAQQRADTAATRAAANAPKTPSDKFPQTVGSLRMLCEVATDEDLPNIWTVLANAKKKEAITAIQALFDARARAPNSTGVSPVVTPTLFECISSMRLTTKDTDELLQGLSPFLVVSDLNAAAAQASRDATVYGLLYSGGAAPALAQLMQLVSTAPDMPTTALSLLRVYQGYGTILDVLMGILHRVAQHFRAFVVAFDTRLPQLERWFPPPAMASVLPLMLHQTHLAMMGYFNRAIVEGENTPLPDIDELINTIDNKRWALLPPLPTQYVQPVPQYVPPVPVQQPAPAPSGGDGGNGAATPGGRQQQQDPRARSVTNTRPNQTWVDRWAADGRRLRDITNNPQNPVPMADNEVPPVEMCLSFALLCRCNTNCTRKKTHRIASHTESERIDGFLDGAGVASA